MDGLRGMRAAITLHVGQRLTLTKGAGWSGLKVSDPVSDRPAVLALVQGPAGQRIGVYEARIPGFADVGAKGGMCGNVQGGCLFGEVQVLP